MIPQTAQHRRVLENELIPFADCGGSLVVVGNSTASTEWLSRMPCAPLLADGNIPVDDPPARQVLGMLTRAMLPVCGQDRNLCVVTVPGVQDDSEQALKNQDFVCRLVQMSGFHPVVVNPAVAALLASSHDSLFTGVSIVMGAETTTICAARFGVPLAANTIPTGGNWIDAELAKQFRVQVWDADGNAYLDIETIRRWKQKSGVNLKSPGSERDHALSRLYAVLLDRVARTVARMLHAPAVQNLLQTQQLSVFLSGGATQINGLSELLTDHFVEHQIAERIRCVRSVANPATAVIRGALIFGQLEAAAVDGRSAA